MREAIQDEKEVSGVGLLLFIDSIPEGIEDSHSRRRAYRYVMVIFLILIF